ncbi:hypothetical protein lerEdw1_014409 [Lerista edwardsae]|nr:hypothetical protein lerEdw1_014409 [Lerista edwardsae]
MRQCVGLLESREPGSIFLLVLKCSLTTPTHRKRRGAINSKQLTYLEKYRPKQRLRFKDPQNHKNKCCIM